MPRKTKGWSPVETLEFAVKWETIRAAYFAQKGQNSKADEIISKVRYIKADIASAGYHRLNDEAVFCSE